MAKERRKWSEQQKLQVIQEVEMHGQAPVGLSRLVDLNNKNSIQKSAMHFNLNKSRGSAIFGYLLASECIINFFSKNSQTVFRNFSN